MSDDIDKITYAFNKFFSGFVRDVKGLSEDLRGAIKANYKIIDKSSSEYLDSFWENVGVRLLDTSFDLLAVDNGSVQVAKDVSIGAILSTDEDVTSILNTIYTLAIFAYLKKKVDANDAEKLFDQAVKILNTFNTSPGAFDEEVEDVIDDDMKSLFLRIKPTLSIPSDEEAATDQMEDIMGKFGDGKIANLAKEIAQSINVDDLKIESPADVMKMLDFSQGGNNALGNIVQQVTSAISNKVSSGELKQEDLVKEAMSMMGSLGGMGGGAGGAAGLFNNPLFSSMMKNMAGGRAGVRKDVVSKMATRDRLRKKYESKHGSQSTEK